MRRRQFVKTAGLFALGTVAGCRTSQVEARFPVFDIHQHAGYSGRQDEILLAHQEAMGVRRTLLLPSGRPTDSPATDGGKANGLQAQCLGNEACYRLARENPDRFLFAANEVPDHPDARKEIEKYLKLGAVAIAEQKFCLACDSAPMQELYRMAADYGVPILMHFQHGTYNHGFEGFYRMLDRHPRTTFIGHAQTWWANIGKEHRDQTVLYPKGQVTPGGLTDLLLAAYPNCYGDLSAGSGLNALLRDEQFTVDFLARHQKKLLYGSDCNDGLGNGPGCQGAATLAAVRRLAGSPEVCHRILCGNAQRLFRLGDTSMAG